MTAKIIVVEDDVALCYAIGRALEHAGYEVETCTGSTDAWTHVGESAHLDLLLTDLMFPTGQPNGIALARNALYHHPGLPVIYMTAYPKAAEQAKVEDGTLLVKPIDLGALIRRIGETLAAP